MCQFDLPGSSSSIGKSSTWERARATCPSKKPGAGAATGAVVGRALRCSAGAQPAVADKAGNNAKGKSKRW